MKMVLVIVFAMLVGLYLSGCATTQSTMKVCKNLCTHNVKSFSDDNAECICQLEAK